MDYESQIDCLLKGLLTQGRLSFVRVVTFFEALWLGSSNDTMFLKDPNRLLNTAIYSKPQSNFSWVVNDSQSAQ